MVGGEGKGKKKENPPEVEMEANVQALSQEIMNLEALKEVQSADAEGRKGTAFFDEWLKADSFVFFTERGGQSKQIAIYRSKTLREGGRNGQRVDQAG